MNSSKKGKELIDHLKVEITKKRDDLENMLERFDSLVDKSKGTLEMITTAKQITDAVYQLQAAVFKLQADNLIIGPLALSNAGDNYIALVKHIANQKPLSRC